MTEHVGMTTAELPLNEVLEARLSCEQLFHRFSACIDRGRATEAIDLFTDDGVVEIGGRTFNGRAEVLEFLTAREAHADRQTRHLGANFDFRMTGPDGAQASALVVVFATAGDAPSTAPQIVSDCELTFRRDPETGWRVASRRHRRFAAAPATT
jgi:hypothetical protein